MRIYRGYFRVSHHIENLQHSEIIPVYAKCTGEEEEKGCTRRQ